MAAKKKKVAKKIEKKVTKKGVKKVVKKRVVAKRKEYRPRIGAVVYTENGDLGILDSIVGDMANIAIGKTEQFQIRNEIVAMELVHRADDDAKGAHAYITDLLEQAYRKGQESVRTKVEKVEELVEEQPGDLAMNVVETAEDVVRAVLRGSFADEEIDAGGNSHDTEAEGEKVFDA